MKAYWIENSDRKNYEICITKKVRRANKASISLIAQYTYNLFVNGHFVCYGPARTAGGYARVDHIDISSFLTEEENIISVYCLSVETKTLCFAGGESYVGCELTVDGVTCDVRAFDCFLMTDRIDKVERMSAQRGYVEVYRQSSDRSRFLDCERVCLVEKKTPKLLERRVPFADNEIVQGTAFEEGSVTFDCEEEWKACLVAFLNDCADGDFYPPAVCETVLYKELQKMQFHKEKEGSCRYRLYDLGQTYSGKIKIQISVPKKVNLWVIYDDLLTEDKVSFGREQIIHGLKWSLEKGKYTLYSSEVYTMRYLQLVFDEQVQDVSVSLIKIEHPIKKEMIFDDAELTKIYEAAQNTFKQNAYDLFTDCPSRERAGWLCDSYFTAKAERYFTGDNVVERNFLENYLLYDGDEFAHKGILPECYPSVPKHANDFIPNWILWFVVELYDFVIRTGDVLFAEKFQDKIRGILSYFQDFEDEYGFLEKLQGWVFLEWSQANEFMNDVNFPSNMLYYGALKSAGYLLKDEKLLEKAEQLKEKIYAFSFDGEYFCDNAIWRDGVLERTENRSETCQYFAAFFDVVKDKKTFVRKLIKKQDGFYAAPMFIGCVLRLSNLFEAGEYECLLRECKENFLPMAERTGTIWEFFDESASCNHGFGSIVGYFLAEAYQKCKV